VRVRCCDLEHLDAGVLHTMSMDTQNSSGLRT
jgi:hypothetical protein